MSLTVSRNPINGVSSGLTSGSIPSALVIRDVPDFIQYMKRRDRPMLSLSDSTTARNTAFSSWRTLPGHS